HDVPEHVARRFVRTQGIERDVLDVPTRGVSQRARRRHAAHHAPEHRRKASGLDVQGRSGCRETLQMTMRRGFSLIEVMVSLTLLAIVVMSLARVSTVISIRARSTDVVAKRMAVLQMEANKF